MHESMCEACERAWLASERQQMSDQGTEITFLVINTSDWSSWIWKLMAWCRQSSLLNTHRKPRHTPPQHTHTVWEMGREEVWSIKRSYEVHLKDSALNAHRLSGIYTYIIEREYKKVTYTQTMTPQHTNNTKRLKYIYIYKPLHCNIILRKWVRQVAF